MKLVFMGCVQFSFVTLRHLLKLNIPNLEIVGIVTREVAPFNADFASLVPLAKEKNIPCFVASGNNQSEMLSWLTRFSPDIIYCFGWSYLLKEPVLKLPPLGIVGYHPAALPRNRGRHPIIWALVLHLQETASTFFFMDGNADSGDILSQHLISIDDSDDAGTLYQKLTDAACLQLAEFTPQLINGAFKRVAQNQTEANYWRKRSKADGVIDWRMSSKCIHNLVRALTRPYMGSHFIYESEEVRVWKTALIDEMPGFENIEPGKILEVNKREITIKCGEGLLKLIEYDRNLPVRPGDYL